MISRKLKLTIARAQKYEGSTMKGLPDHRWPRRNWPALVRVVAFLIILNGLVTINGFAQIFCGNFNAVEYTTSGGFMRATTELGVAQGIAFATNGDLLVVDRGNAAPFVHGSVAQYSQLGILKNRYVVQNLHLPVGIAADKNGFFYIASASDGTIGKFAMDGTVVASALISGLASPEGVAVDDSGYLYVGNYGPGGNGTGTIGKYTTSGNT